VEGLSKKPNGQDVALEHFRGDLYPFQKEGVQCLSFWKEHGWGGLLADEMGLGKTVQLLAFFSGIRRNLPHLIVAPSSLLHHWKKEIETFVPSTSVLVYSNLGQTEVDLASFHWVIVSYAMLRREIDRFATQQFDGIALDESHWIKNRASQTAKAVFRLQGRVRVALSGTPVENRKEDLVSQFQFLMPNWIHPGMELDRIKEKIAPFYLRRTKRDVGCELPPKVEQTVWIDMTQEQKELYDQYLQTVKEEMLPRIQQDGFSSCRLQILERLVRLRQIALDPRIIQEPIPGAKLIHFIDEMPKGKLLVYSQFTTMLQLIRQALVDLGIHYLYLDGSIDLKKRHETVEKFQQESQDTCFLLSLKAAGVGLNLQSADYVILFDPWWHQGVENQAVARAHRLGRKEGATLIARRYISVGSIEEKMLQLQQHKQELVEHLFQHPSEGCPSQLSWTEEDWLHLLD
jgi:SNF2 family DNA or RNA helicase